MIITHRLDVLRKLAAAASLTVLCAVGFGASQSALASDMDATDVQSPAAPVAMTGVPDFSRITRRYGAAVVNIGVSGMRKVSVGTDDADAATDADGPQSDPMQLFLRQFQQQFGGSRASMQVPVHAMGSGFIVSNDGLVHTNVPVVADASEGIAKLTDPREFRAREPRSRTQGSSSSGARSTGPRAEAAAAR